MGKQDQKKSDEHKADIARANDILEKVRLDVTRQFAEPIHKASRDAARLAKYLSEKFPTMKLMVTFVNGSAYVFAEPMPKVFEATHEHYLEQKAQEALAATTKSDQTWPFYAEVRAYAIGYEDASEGKRALEQEIVRLKEKLEHFREMLPPWPMMYGPGGFFGRPYGG